jgi:ParB family chromosome partitioning protein
MKFELLGLHELRPSPTNPRKDFDENRVADMAASISSIGLLEPLLVVSRGDHYEIVSGETRYRACVKVGMAGAPCVIREMSPGEILKAQMAENIARSGLNPMEEADGLAAMRELGGLGEEEIAAALGTTRKWVQARLALTGLPDRAKDAVRIRAMSVTVAKEILELESSEMDEAAEMLLEFGEDVTGAQARQQLVERYRAPRERRQAWRKRFEEIAERFGACGDPLDDCEEWASYLRPYGESYGKWVDARERLGGATVREADAGLTWLELAMVLRIRGIVVPLRGDGEPLLVFDRSQLEAVEKAAKENGLPHTLGARRKDGGEEAPEPECVYHADEDDEEDAPEPGTAEHYRAQIVEALCGMDDGEVVNAFDEELEENPGALEGLLRRLGLGDAIAGLLDLEAGKEAA